MKLDYDLFREILEHIEATGDGQTRQRISAQDDISELFSCESFDALGYHFKLLADSSFIEGKAEIFAYRGDRAIMGVDYFGLTLEGHQLLDSMRNDGIWAGIVSTAKQLGVAGLKQIPALAIALLKGS